MRVRVMLLTLLLGALGCAGAQQGPAVRTTLPLFPDLEAPLMEGGKVAIRDLRGTVVVLDVMASWCQTCTELLPAWDRLAAQYKGRKFQLLLVSQDEDPEEMRTLARARDLHHSIALDGTEVWWNALRLGSVPTAIVIGADGRQVAVIKGLAEGGWTRLEAVVAAEVERAERGR